MDHVGILSEAFYLPPDKKLVSDVFRDEDVPFGTLSKNIDFQRDIGIHDIHVTDEMPSVLALEAARRALDEAGVAPDEVDLVVDFTSIPEDYVGPTWSAAGLVQEELGLVNAFATAVNTGGCASYHLALKSVMSLILSDSGFETALLFAGDRTPELNKTYYPITVASDGGSAIVLRRNAGRARILGVETISIGRLHDVWYVPGLQSRQPNEEVSEKLLHMYAKMDKFNEGVIPINFRMFGKVMKKLLDKCGLTQDDVDYYIYPTFSTWDQAYFMKKFGLTRDKVYTSALKHRGHVQESDMVINYAEAVAQGHIRPGDKVMVVSNGAGFAWSAALVEH
ncbi:3-oxoacyl-ACP synthase III family protein [Stappia sp.]|jgi:3-oxoacyl-[acyl-carrier-protein] synthase-3|uniref:3-oxoacyl-ACP synthase III family protein n=1 Tax=Stappia sp. TaxID=1870903 RepID=UPI003A9A37CE